MESVDHQETVHRLECRGRNSRGYVGWGGGARPDLVSCIKGSGLYSGGCGESLNGFEEASDTQIPYWKSHSHHRDGLLAGGAREEAGKKRGLTF